MSLETSIYGIETNVSQTGGALVFRPYGKNMTITSVCASTAVSAPGAVITLVTGGTVDGGTWSTPGTVPDSCLQKNVGGTYSSPNDSALSILCPGGGAVNYALPVPLQVMNGECVYLTVSQGQLLQTNVSINWVE